MISRGGSWYVPYLLKPLVKVFLVNLAVPSLHVRRLAIATGLPLHQDELNIVLYDRIRLVGLTEEFRAADHFVRSIRDFVPYDRIEVVEADFAALDTNIGMERKDKVSAETAP
jgi:hypothetical protein